MSYKIIIPVYECDGCGKLKRPVYFEDRTCLPKNWSSKEGGGTFCKKCAKKLGIYKKRKG